MLINKLNGKNGLLHNTYLLYFIFLIAIVDLFIMISNKDYQSSVVFILTGILTSFFSKNMIVILLFSIFISHVLKNKITENESFEYGNEIESFDVIGESPANADSDIVENKSSQIDENANENKDLQNDGVQNDGVQKNSVQKNSVQKDSVQKDSVQKNSVQKNSVIKDHLQKDHLQKDVNSENKKNGVPGGEKNLEEKKITLTPEKKYNDDMNRLQKKIENIDSLINDYEPFINAMQSLANKLG
jgi:pentapeptide MXKDX repeat protein